MKLGARVGFSRLEELESHFEGVDFPIELALPHQVGNFLAIADRMGEVRDFVQGRGIEVLTVHAPQGDLLIDAYVRWARPTMWLADELGASAVVFHPNQTKSERLHGQSIARKHLEDLQDGAKALATIETFGGKRRVFHPEEIVSLGLPMVLDTAHLHDDHRILGLINDYHTSIPVVHLSARGDDEHHLPMDDFCLKVADLLAELEWQGSLILEYLPWHHYRIRSDLHILRRFLEGNRSVGIPPPDDKFKDDPSRWGYV